MRSFKTINVQSLELSKVQDNVDHAISPVLTQPILGGVLLESVSLTSGKDNIINHRLGRKLRLWVLARQNTNTNVWELPTSAPDSTLNLWCGSSCTVSLWVA